VDQHLVNVHMKENRMKRILALCCVLVLAGCGSSNSQQANANTAAQPVNEVATVRPQATDVAVLGVSQPYQLGAPKGG
jgi:uncharacterized lipoprotein YajG